MNRCTKTLVVGIPCAGLLLSPGVFAQGMSGMSGTTPQWQCTLVMPNPMSGMAGQAPFACVQWTHPGFSAQMSGHGAVGRQVPLGVSFEVGTAELTEQARSNLAGVLDRLPQLGGSTYMIVGHTDNIGDADANQALSLERAEAVKRFFVQNGLDANRISTRGMGELAPVADNDSDEGKARNRRVELYLY